MADLYVEPGSSTSPSKGLWWKELNRYHWFVLIVAALGWLFDCLDQQLFLLARAPAMADLLKPGQDPNEYGGYATAIFVLGWATGGLSEDNGDHDPDLLRVHGPECLLARLC